MVRLAFPDAGASLNPPGRPCLRWDLLARARAARNLKNHGVSPCPARAAARHPSRPGGLLLPQTHEDSRRLIADIHAAGREQDLVLMSRRRFNFLRWGQDIMGFPVESLVAWFTQTAETLNRLDQAIGGDSRIWITHMQTPVRNGLLLLSLAGEPLTLNALHRLIIVSAPNAGDPGRDAWRRRSFCYRMIEQAEARVKRLGDPLTSMTSPTVKDYFLTSWANLNDRTKSSIQAVFLSLADPLLHGPLYQMSLPMSRSVRAGPSAPTS